MLKKKTLGGVVAGVVVAVAGVVGVAVGAGGGEPEPEQTYGKSAQQVAEENDCEFFERYLMATEYDLDGEPLPMSNAERAEAEASQDEWVEAMGYDVGYCFVGGNRVSVHSFMSEEDQSRWMHDGMGKRLVVEEGWAIVDAVDF